MNGVIFCQSCGQQNTAESAFCGKCGRHLKDNIMPAQQVLPEFEPFVRQQSEAGLPEDLSSLRINENLLFGHYPQSTGSDRISISRENISWRVLAVEDGNALLIAERILDCKAYHKEKADVTWETCSLRKWLNDDFYNRSFSPAEKERIIPTVIINEENPKYGTPGGNDTTDKVFLLSYDETDKLFEDDRGREAQGTEYALSKGMFVSKKAAYAKNSRWWLRSPGGSPHLAGVVHYSGYVYYISYNVTYEEIGVRPAIWVNIQPEA